MNDYLGKAMMMSSVWRTTLKDADKSVEDIEAELVGLRIKSDKRVDFEQLSHQVYIDQNLLANFERDISATKAVITELQAMPELYREHMDTLVQLAACKGRLKAYEATYAELTEKLVTSVQQLKEGAFAYCSKDLRKELEDAKQALLNPPAPEEPMAVVLATE